MNSIDLSGLRDIYEPASPNVFPPAIGWWILLFLICVAFFLLYHLFDLYFYSTLREVKKEITKLSSLSDKDFFIAVNLLAKRVAIRKYGRKKIAPMMPAEWFDFLNQDEKKCFGKEYLDFFEKCMYDDDNKFTLPNRKQVLKNYYLWIKNTLKRNTK